MTDYIDRLKIPILGNNTTIFTTFSDTNVSVGYLRIVIGKRGPYIEFDLSMLSLASNFYVPENEVWRKNNKNSYYKELRTKDASNVKVYWQTKLVNYADYKIGLIYISPFDLLADNKIIIEKLNMR